MENTGAEAKTQVVPATDAEIAAWRPIALQLASTGLHEERYCGALILRIEQEQAAKDGAMAHMALAMAEVERLRQTLAEHNIVPHCLGCEGWTWHESGYCSLCQHDRQPPAPAEVPSGQA